MFSLIPCRRQGSASTSKLSDQGELTDRVLFELNLLDRTHSRENVFALVVDLNLAFECLFVHPFDSVSFLAERRFVKGPLKIC